MPQTNASVKGHEDGRTASLRFLLLLVPHVPLIPLGNGLVLVKERVQQLHGEQVQVHGKQVQGDSEQVQVDEQVSRYSSCMASRCGYTASRCRYTASRCRGTVSRYWA